MHWASRLHPTQLQWPTIASASTQRGGRSVAAAHATALDEPGTGFRAALPTARTTHPQALPLRGTSASRSRVNERRCGGKVLGTRFSCAGRAWSTMMNRTLAWLLSLVPRPFPSRPKLPPHPHSPCSPPATSPPRERPPPHARRLWRAPPAHAHPSIHLV